MMQRHVFAVVFGALVGLVFTEAVNAQSADVITQSGAWAVEIECAAQVALTTSVDGGPATAVTSVVWTGTGPYKTTVAYPTATAARTLGPHTFAISTPSTTITLANGDPYIYPAGTLTRSISVLPDVPPQAQPPKFLRWLKILGSIALAVGAIWIGLAL